MSSRSAAVIGLGRIGLPFALHLASRNVTVKGVEQDPSRRAAIMSGSVRSNEPCFQDWFAAHGSRLELTDLAAAVSTTDVSFVVVPTPSENHGSLSHALVLGVVREIAASVSRTRRPHTIAVVSTLMPGTSRGVLAECIASAGSEAELCYSPVLVSLGDVFAGLDAPPFILIGADVDRAADKLAEFYQAAGWHPSLLARMDSISAEVAKLALNGFLATKIAFANAIDGLCDAAGARPDAVLGVLGRDPRVGARYLRGGPPYGGPCLGRDVAAFGKFSEDCGVAPVLAGGVIQSNRIRYDGLLRRALAHAPCRGATFGIVGLAYKAGTDYLDDGFGLSLARDLACSGHAVLVHDAAWRGGVPPLPAGVEFVSDVGALARRCDVCVLTYPDADLRDQLRAAGRILIDIWSNNASA